MPTPTDTPVSLSNAEPFAVGGRRLCFVHPGDPTVCIKVNRVDEQRFERLPRKRIIPASLRRGLDDNRHDRRLLSSLQRRLGRRYAHLPRYHGDVETDIGRGIAIDLIRDADGQIARTIRNLIVEGVPLDELRPAFDEFARYLERNRVLTRALLDHNIVAARGADGGWTLYLIDGFGDPAFISLGSLIPSIGRAKMRRRAADAWRRFEELERADPDARRWDTSRWSQGFLNHRGADRATHHG
jgi:hypothetical protein